jgi:hypothetical protein
MLAAYYNMLAQQILAATPSAVSARVFPVHSVRSHSLAGGGATAVGCHAAARHQHRAAPPAWCPHITHVTDNAVQHLQGA